MQSLSQQVLAYASQLPEGMPIAAKELLHLGGRDAVTQVLSRLAARGALLRVDRGIYVVPVVGRFGTRAPAVAKLVDTIACLRDETIVIHGAVAANVLGLTTQVPMRSIYLTSGRSRQLKLGAQKIEFRHAPRWQLIFPGRPAGDLVRALAWLGPEKAPKAIQKLRSKLPATVWKEIASVPARLPNWLAQALSTLVPKG